MGVDINEDGTKGFVKTAIRGGDLGLIAAWHGANDPTAANNKIPANGLFLNVGSREMKRNAGTEAAPIWESLGGFAPVGTVLMSARSAAPTGWLLCDGTAISRADYAALYAAIGDAFGAGDGATTFNLPDIRQRFPRGANDGADVGDTGGESTHTLTIDEMPSHTHDTTLKHIGSGVLPSKPLPSGQSGNNPVDTTATGGDAAHENKPPYIDLLAVIKY